MTVEQLDVIIPVFNEYSRDPSRFGARARYIASLAERWQTVVVDDGSNDGTSLGLDRLLAGTGPNMRLIHLVRNRRKVGAIRAGLDVSSTPLVLLLDFDSSVDVAGMGTACDYLLSREDSGACGFRVSASGGSVLAGFQDLEFAISAMSRTQRFRAEGRIDFAQGACVLWKRSVLSRVIDMHSGRHERDDAELSAIAYAAGYRTLYDDRVVAKTTPVERVQELVRQRAEWYGSEPNFKKGMELASPLRLAKDMTKLLRNPTYVERRRDLTLLPFYPFYKASVMVMGLARSRPSHVPRSLGAD